jgi:preprotein translocase subunit SecG
MITVVLVIHLLIATALVGVILIQRSEGGALGGLGGGTFGGLMTTRGTANLLTRTTAILAACFIGTSLLLAILASNVQRGRSILDAAPAATAPAAPTPAPAAPAAPAAPSEPAAPIAR